MKKETIPKEKKVFVIRSAWSGEYIKHYKQEWRANKYCDRAKDTGRMFHITEENIDTLNEEINP